VTASAYDDVEVFWNDTWMRSATSCRAPGCGLPLHPDRRNRIREVRRSRRAGALAPAARIGAPSFDRYIDVTNQVTRDIPDLHIGMPSCRGNLGGRWHAQGSYDAVAESCSTGSTIPFSFSNTTARAPAISQPCGSCEAQVHCARLVSTKTPAMEDFDDLRRASPPPAVSSISIARRQPAMRLRQCRDRESITPQAQEAKLRLWSILRVRSGDKLTRDAARGAYARATNIPRTRRHGRYSGGHRGCGHRLIRRIRLRPTISSGLPSPARLVDIRHRGARHWCRHLPPPRPRSGVVYTSGAADQQAVISGASISGSRPERWACLAPTQGRAGADQRRRGDGTAEYYFVRSDSRVAKGFAGVTPE